MDRHRLAHSADEYNLHGAKRLFTIPNVLSASRPSVNLDGENKPFLHIDFSPRIPPLIQRNADRHLAIG